jgi:effector-binding domain-containing protein
VQVQVKPQGLYVKLITADGYHSQYAKALQKMLAFIQRNDLEVTGDAYINQLRNYWSTTDPSEYITQIEIPVAYKNS